MYICATYLLDREADRLLAYRPITCTIKDDGLGCLVMEEDGDGGNLLDHFGGVIDRLLLQNLVVGKCSNTPHVGVDSIDRAQG